MMTTAPSRSSSPRSTPKQPNERVVDLLAQLKMKAGQLDEAEKLYELARKDDPFHTKWIAGLARVHLRQRRRPKFLADLAMIAANDADDLAVRKALAERHLAAESPEAEKWANECLYIDVYDPTIHVLLADALAAGKKFAAAIDEYKTLSSSPRNPMTSRSSWPRPSFPRAAAMRRRPPLTAS